ncbi:DUF2575 domain-containing protein [Atlantibacter hermannii]|nr:DUF2575 domain-containing protein [Atlantibacter hermannii]
MKRHLLRSDGAGFYQLASREYSLSGTKIVKVWRNSLCFTLSALKQPVSGRYLQSLVNLESGTRYNPTIFTLLSLS